jgi:hypothetical protein
VQLDGGSEQLLRPAPDAPIALLLRHYRDQGVRVAMATFRPAEVPALMLYPQGAELAREAEASLQAGDLPGGLAGLVQGFVEGKFSSGDELRGTLYLNAANPLVHSLAEGSPAPAARGRVLDLLHQVARLFAGRMLSAGDAVAAFGQLSGALEGLLRR